MVRQIRKLAIASGILAASLWMAAPVGAAAQPPVEGLVELSEVWARGKHLSELIVDAEDEFFKHYNKANKNSAYDIYCGMMSLHKDSMIMIRRCVPGFVVYNSYSPATNMVSYGPECYGTYGNTDPNTGGTYYTSNCYQSAAPAYVPASPPTGLLLLERGPAYVKHVVTVVSADPRLVVMANKLVDLYNELESAQHHYVKVKNAAAPSSPDRKSTKRNLGPRLL